MTIIELYINNRLCDVGRDFTIRLNRQLLNPGELNTKDAQYSYSITLPPTSNNHAIFNYANIEETKDKFNREYRAELIINSVRVFVGLFRLSLVTHDTYKGNLYIPSTKSIKNVFGERKLNENPEYRIEFKDFAEYVSRYNRQAATGPQMAIFPYTLYGLLPKIPGANGWYSGRNVWDDTVRVGMQDIPPSINPLLMLRHIFESNGYKLGGSAFSDARLTNLYMSYKNDPDYVQPWNYGQHASMRVDGVWSSTHNKRTNAPGRQLERGVYQNYSEGYDSYAVDLLNSTNLLVTNKYDPGANVLYRESSAQDDSYSRSWANCQIRIPVAGFYKVRFVAGLKILDNSGNPWRDTDTDTDIQHVCRYTNNADNVFPNKMYEVRLIRDRVSGDFGLSGAKLNGTFYRDNMPQNARFEGDDGFNSETDVPKYFPVDSSRGHKLLIDPRQDRNAVVGFAFGVRQTGEYRHPLDISATPTLSQIQVARPGRSWDTTVSDVNRLAFNNERYLMYGFPDQKGTTADDPTLTPDDTIQWGFTDRFKIELENTPAGQGDFAVRGLYNGTPGDSNLMGSGQMTAVVWFDAGELLTVVSVTQEGNYRNGNMHSVYGITEHEVTFSLTVDPFRTDSDWLKVDDAGKGTAPMNWDDPTNFDVDSIDLVKFLPSDMTIDAFIDATCKTFNLSLIQVGEKIYELNVKQSKTSGSNRYINLDNLASIRDRINTPLGLPSRYKLGFTIDTEEEGYSTTQDDGGGEFETGATDDRTIDQKSAFSYNWFKEITKQQTGSTVAIQLAIISKHEVWTDEISYSDAMIKRYTNQAIRFWYPDGLLNDLGVTFDFNGRPLSIAKVSNELPGLMILNYENRKLTILNNYFTLLINGSSHYTEVEGYLTPYQYEDLNGSIMAMFNGDLYYVAEVSGYDPTGRNKTKIKLIRKI